MNPSATEPLAGFIAVLRANQFTIGVREMLAAQSLLADLPADADPARVKTLLCPLFASSQEQQSRFYALFDASFPGFEPREPVPPPPVNQNADRPRPWRIPIWGAAVVAVGVTCFLAIGAYYRWLNQPVLPLPRPVMVAIQPPAWWDRGVPPPPPPPVKRSERSDNEAPPPPAPTYFPAPEATDLRDSRPASWWYLLLALPPVLAAAWLQFRIWRHRRRILATPPPPRKPPVTWSLSLRPVPLLPFQGTHFIEAARQLRQREPGETTRVDPEATVMASVPNLGFPTIRFRRQTRRPEYLVLIDSRSPRDHQARLFSELAEALRIERVHLQCYYFSGDPAFCVSDRGEPVALADLYARTSHHRLIVFADAEVLVDSRTGTLRPTVRSLDRWPRVALATPKHPRAWREAEELVAGQVLLIPADVPSLARLPDAWESHRPAVVGDGRDQPPPTWRPGLAGEELDRYVGDLRRWLGPGMFRWLCGCALYPRLEWELTVEIGRELGQPVDDSALRRLARIPWFRQGLLPDDLQQALASRLSANERLRIRRLLTRVLQASPPEPGTWAEDHHALEVAVQTRDWQPRERSAVRHDPNPVSLRLAAAASRDEASLLARWMYRRGIREFGLRGSALSLLLTVFFGLLSGGAWLAEFSSVLPGIVLGAVRPPPFAYEKSNLAAAMQMGSWPVERGVAFRVWAPLARQISVSGTFNAWSRTENPMQKAPNGRWFTVVPSATAGQEYEYYIVNNLGESFRNDPYARMFSSNQKSVIPPENFGPAPDGFRPRERNQLVLYQLHVGTFGRDFNGVAARLPYLRDLGINAIQLMPIAEFPFDSSWGFNTCQPFAVESAYGGAEQFRRFVEAAHAQGIALFLDVNYVSWSDCQGLYAFDRQSANDPGVYFSDQSWAGGIVPAYSREDVRQFIIDNAVYWLEKWRLDGLRVEEAGVIDNHQGWYLVQDLTSTVRFRNPEKLLLTSHSGPDRQIATKPVPAGMGFDAQWDERIAIGLRGAGKEGPTDVSALADAIRSYPDAGAFSRVVYGENFDLAGDPNGSRLPRVFDPANARSFRARNLSYVAAAILLTAPGIPMLFQGQEWMEDKRFDDRTPVQMSQGPVERAAYQCYRDLIRLRGQLTGLHAANVNVFHVNPGDRVIAYHRWSNGGPGDDAVVIANLGETAFPEYRVGMPRSGQWSTRFDSRTYDLLADQRSEPSSVSIRSISTTGLHGLPASATVTLGPYSALILTPAR